MDAVATTPCLVGETGELLGQTLPGHIHGTLLLEKKLHFIIDKIRSKLVWVPRPSQLSFLNKKFFLKKNFIILDLQHSAV